MKTEKVLAAITIVGLIFKLMYWPFSGPILVVGLGTLMMLYLIGGFYFFSDTNIKKQNLPLSIISGLFLMNACMAILYKLMFWPFSGPLLMIAVSTIPVILVIAFGLRSATTRTDLTTYYNNMITRLIIISFLVIILFFTSTVTLVKIIHSDDPERVRLQTRSMMNPDNEEYRKEFNEYLDQEYSKDVQPEENGK